jgi:hypothetical protein
LGIVAERVGDGHEARPGVGAAVLPGLDHAVLRFAQQVEVAVVVEVREPVPLPDVEPLVAVGPPLESHFGPRGALEQDQLTCRLLDEQVEVRVAVEVDELRPRHVEAPEEREPVGRSLPVGHLEGIDPPLEGGQGLRDRARGNARHQGRGDPRGARSGGLHGGSQRRAGIVSSPVA